MSDRDQDQHQNGDQPADLAANKELARQFFARLSAGDVDGLVALYADTCTCWVAGTLPFSGRHPRERLPELIRGVGVMFPEGLRFDVRSMTAEGDRVCAEAESFGRHVSGQVYNQLYHYLFVIRDGKIEEIKEYFDTVHAQEVLCSMPAPGFNE